MNTYLKIVCFSLFLCISASASAQILYAIGIDYVNSTYILYKIDVATCTVCPVTASSPNYEYGQDWVYLPDGTQIVTNHYTVTHLEALPGTNVIAQVPTNYFSYCATLAPNGQVYIGGENGLGIFDPVTNQVTFLGAWPAAWGVGLASDLFYLNGVLYGAYQSNANGLYLMIVNVDHPDQSQLTTQSALFGPTGMTPGAWNGVNGIFYRDLLTNDLGFYDPATSIGTILCDLPNTIDWVCLETPPPGVVEQPCVCNTNAGIIPSGNPISICVNTTANLPAANQTTLDFNDQLQYILFSNPADTLGSIVAISNTPGFDFNPATMTAGVPYYYAAIAGNNLNGAVNTADPCLDFSNARVITWRPLPTVSFSTGNANLCPGQCATITATFTGNAPFLLQYTTPGGSFSQSFGSNSDTFQVCTPASASQSNWTVAATALTDASCSCQ